MANRQLALGTISFAICFAAWGLISAFATRFREIYNLSASQTAFLIAAPVLLGSLARIPMGLLTDRWKGRAVFTSLLLFSAILPLLAPVVSSYSMLLVVGFVLGMAGSSFAVGVGFVSPWFGREKQGTALGVYGLGNAAQSVVVFLGPVLAMRFGWENVFRGISILLVVWAVMFALFARNAPTTVPSRKLGAMLALLRRERLAWVLSVFYFLTFGGFIAFSIYLPALLRQEFQLTAADAGFRTAGFVLLATGMRPIGGWLSGRIGGARVLSLVFLGIVPFALLLAWVPLLIIDDFGMRKLPHTAAEDLLEIIMRRYERFSTLLTSNRPVEDWGKLLGDVAAVSAMLDRLLHHGHVLKCGPRSWRTKTAPAS